MYRTLPINLPNFQDFLDQALQQGQLNNPNYAEPYPETQARYLADLDSVEEPANE